MSRKHKMVYTTLNYMEHFLFLSSTITGCIAIFAFDLLPNIPTVITSSVIELKICVVTARIKK